MMSLKNAHYFGLDSSCLVPRDPHPDDTSKISPINAILAAPPCTNKNPIINMHKM